MVEWINNSEILVSDNAIGFTYIITNLTKNKYYIGKKLFNKGWEKYTGSSKELNMDIKNGDVIKKEILGVYSSKGMLSYAEIKLQIENDVMFKDEFYNKFIGCKIHQCHLKG